MSAKPVLVVHGIANHDRVVFEKQVSALQDSLRGPLPSVSLIPVFWGDQGGQSESINDCLPQLKAGQWTTRAESLFSISSGGEPVRAESAITNDGRAAIIAAAVPATAVRSDRAAIEDAIAQALDRTTYLQRIDDRDTLSRVGEILLLAVKDTPASADAGEFAVRGEEGATRSSLTDKIGNAIAAVDRLAGQLVEDRLGALTQRIRASLMEGVAATLGDIIAYQANRASVQQRLFDAIKQHAPEYGTSNMPIGVIAHSLGGVIAVDTAVAPASGVPLYIDSLVTFGSQSAFFEIVNPSDPKAPYRTGHPITLPATIRQWFNMWDVVDLLGFTAGTVFRLKNGDKPEDIPLEDPLSVMLDAKLWLHSIYWKTTELTDVLARAFA
jgi:hypothetical protein